MYSNNRRCILKILDFLEQVADLQVNLREKVAGGDTDISIVEITRQIALQSGLKMKLLSIILFLRILPKQIYVS